LLRTCSGCLHHSPCVRRVLFIASTLVLKQLYWQQQGRRRRRRRRGFMLAVENSFVATALTPTISLHARREKKPRGLNGCESKRSSGRVRKLREWRRSDLKPNVSLPKPLSGKDKKQRCVLCSAVQCSSVQCSGAMCTLVISEEIYLFPFEIWRDV
jgi:hypothetical protein